MNFEYRTFRQGRSDLLYDADLFPAPPESFLFDPVQLEKKGLLRASARGRGEAYFFDFEGYQWVLRHFRRGGLIGKIFHDQYLGCAAQRSRAWKEWHLLARLCGMGLPVPRPVAARVVQGVGVYRADLITQMIPDSITLAGRLQKEALSGQLWAKLGACVRRFHDAGVYHADLNANNILLNSQESPFLLDFDRGAIRGDGAWKKQNIARLQRSLQKIKRQCATFHWDEEAWEHFLAGYRQG